MERERFEVGDRFNLDKSESQERVHTEALGRLAGDAAVCDLTGQSAVVSEREPRPAPVPAEDATLNWASGMHVASASPYGEIPFDARLGQVAGVAGVERSTQPAPETFRPITSAPDCSQGNWNMSDIIRGAKR